MNAGDEAFVGKEEKRHARSFIDAAGLGLDDAVLDLVGHAETVTAADAVGLFHESDGIRELLPIDGDGNALLEFNRDRFRLDFNVVAPEGDAHDRLDDLHVGIEAFQVLGLMRGAEHVRVGRVGLLGAHAVVEALLLKEGRHFGAAAELADELHVEPRLVDLEVRVGKKTVAVEALDVVALVRGSVTPDVDAVLTHGGDEHRARHGAAERSGVEVKLACRRDVEGAGLNGGDAFVHELFAAVDQAGVFGAVLHGATRNGFIVSFVGLAEVGRVGVRQSALVLHPAKSSARIEAAGKGNADFLADGNALKDRFRHVLSFL